MNRRCSPVPFAVRMILGLPAVAVPFVTHAADAVPAGQELRDGAHLS